MKKIQLIFKLARAPLDNTEKGSMLLEVLVAIFIFMLLLGLVFSILATGRNAWYIEDVGIELQQELRKAMTVLARDLRQTRLSTIVGVPSTGTWCTSIFFQKPTGVTSGYITWSTQNQFVLGGLNSRQLLRRVTGTPDEVIANNISALQLRRRSTSRNVIEVVLAAQKTTTKGTQISKSLSFQVKVRN